jgi:hypothetical protein
VKYAFLDAWLLSRLTDERVAAGLNRLLHERELVPALTGLSFVELYNPGWQRALGTERGEAAVAFLANFPCVFADPTDIYAAEYDAFPAPLGVMPVRLDLGAFAPEVRSEVLMAFLRRGDLLKRFDVDAERFADTYKRIKEDWVAQATAVVDAVLDDVGVKRRPDGSVRIDAGDREVALLSLDLRLVDDPDTDNYLLRAMTASGHRARFMRGARTTSLAMWHLYAPPNAAERPAQRSSDIGDIHHLSLAPYCQMFTADGTMHRLLCRIAAEVGLDEARLYSPATLMPLLVAAPS